MQNVQQEYLPMQPVTLAVAADLHLIAPTLTDGGEAFTRVVENADGKDMPQIVEIVDAFIADVLAVRPDALILAGDLTFNGAAESHTFLAAKLRELEAGGVPVLVLPGNHDLNSDMAARFHGSDFSLVESPDAGQFAEIYAEFGLSEAMARDAASLSYVYEIRPGLRLLFVDTNTAEAPGAVLPGTLSWVEAQLKAAQEAGARIIAVSHQTVLQHNSAFAEGFVITNRDALLKLYQQYGVRCNLSGHMHIQHVKAFSGLTEIVTSALSVGPCQYGLLTLSEAGGAYESRAGVPQALSDDAVEFLRRNSVRQALAAGDPEMADYIAALNAAYFSGRMDTAPRDDALRARWRAADAFFSGYAESLLEDLGQNFTHAEFTF